MKIEITKVSSWTEVLNAARFTQRKELTEREPSDEFKRKIIIAEHSPLRCLTFNIDLYDIPYYVSVHLCRHVHAQPFVSTSRPDIDSTQQLREDQKKKDPVNMRLFLNAQEIINISKVRLCAKAEAKTSAIWHQVIEKLGKQEPLLAAACVPSCVYRSFCPELKPCGYVNSLAFDYRRNKYYETLKCKVKR